MIENTDLGGLLTIRLRSQALSLMIATTPKREDKRDSDRCIGSLFVFLRRYFRVFSGSYKIALGGALFVRIATIHTRRRLS